MFQERSKPLSVDMRKLSFHSSQSAFMAIERIGMVVPQATGEFGAENY